MRSISWADLLPPLLDAVAEASWIALLYLLVQIAWGGDQVLLAIPLLAAIVALGIVAGRFLRSRGIAEARGATSDIRAGRLVAARERDVATATGLVVLAAAAGWAAAPEVRSALGGLDPAAALSLHPGGWLAGLAVLRGLARARAEEEHDPSRALRLGLPVVAVVWLIGRGIGGAQRGLFEETATIDTLVFMVAGLLALGVAGMRAFARGLGAAAPTTGPHPGGSGVDGPSREGSSPEGSAALGSPPIGGAGDLDWQRNRQWLGLLLAVVAAMVLVALPSISGAGRAVAAALLALLWVAAEVVILAVVVRSIPRALTISIPFLLVSFVVVFLLRLIGFRPEALGEVLAQVRQALQFASSGSPAGSSGDVVTWFGAALVALALVTVVLLVRAWLRRRLGASAGEPFEERVVVLEPLALPGWRPRFWGRRPRPAEPADAVGAYRAAIERLDADPELRRIGGESPAEHADRLGAWQVGGPLLRRLALDYQLARFGGRRLGEREEARALGRWRTLAAILRRRPKGLRAGDGDELEAMARGSDGPATGDARPFGM